MKYTSKYRNQIKQQQNYVIQNKDVNKTCTFNWSLNKKEEWFMCNVEKKAIILRWHEQKVESQQCIREDSEIKGKLLKSLLCICLVNQTNLGSGF